LGSAGIRWSMRPPCFVCCDPLRLCVETCGHSLEARRRGKNMRPGNVSLPSEEKHAGLKEGRPPEGLIKRKKERWGSQDLPRLISTSVNRQLMNERMYDQ